MTKLATLTDKHSYFEDFNVGDVVEHDRGKTFTEMDNVLMCNLVMNTAWGHVNEHRAAQSPFKTRMAFGAHTAALVLGLASGDTGENVIAELGLDKVRFKSPVVHGDTIYAYSEVIDKKDADREDAGEVTFRHWGVKHDETVVFEGERRVLVKRRSHWGEK